MDEVTIVVSNASSMKAGAFRKVFAALLFQIERDWNTSTWVKLGLAPPCRLTTEPTPGAWTLTIAPHGNGSLGEGWHEWVEAESRAAAFVNYASTHLSDLTAFIASHELLEMLVNPVGNRTFTDPSTGDVYKGEVCDPVYGASYELGGQTVADFCEAAWFGIDDGLFFPWYSCRFSVAAPFTLGERGYTEVERAGSGVWVELTA